MASCMCAASPANVRPKIVIMHDYLSAEGVRGKLPSPAQSTKPRTIHWLKMSKLSDLDSFAIDMGESCTHTMSYTLCI